MFFKLVFGVYTLSGVVGYDQNLYWEVGPVLKLLKARKRLSRYIRLKDVVIDHLSDDLCLHLLRMKLMTNKRLMSILNRSRVEGAQLFYDYLDRDDFHVTVCWEGRGVCATLCRKEHSEAQPFSEWMIFFIQDLFEVQPSSGSPAPAGTSVYSPQSPAAGTSGYTPHSPPYPPPDTSCNGYTPQSPPPPYSPTPLDTSRNGYTPQSPPYSPPEDADSISSSISSSSGIEPVSGFTLWLDAIPPNRLFFFYGNVSRRYVAE